MAGTYTPTGNTYSNLTRLELEQLRKSDFTAGGKGLTIGDADGTVGAGSINAEPYFTGPLLTLNDVYSVTLPGFPAKGLLGGGTTPIGVTSRTVKWYGPTYIATGTTGFASAPAVWTDASANFAGSGVLAGDILLIKETLGGDSNSFAVATINAVAPTTLGLTGINNPTWVPTTQLDPTIGTNFQYLIVRPNVTQLFAVPGSGPLGREQSFLMVTPSSTLHANPAPTLNQINADRIRNLASPVFNNDSSVDRADAVFAAPAPRTPLNTVGYRVVLYKSNNTGTGPDLSQPIASSAPVIDNLIPADDQRVTIDYKAGIVRLSCAPRAGDDIKPVGGNQGVNPVTGRLQLYAVFWGVDQTYTGKSAAHLYNVRSTDAVAKDPGVVVFDNTHNGYFVGSTISPNNLFLRSQSVVDDPNDPNVKADLGVILAAGTEKFRGFRFRQTYSNIPRMVVRERLDLVADSFRDAAEVAVGDKSAFSVGGGTAPAQLQGADYAPLNATSKGFRAGDYALTMALKAAATEGYGTVHLRKGKHLVYRPLYVPPGVTVKGEGTSTQVASHFSQALGAWSPVFRFAPNTSWGVYDMDWNEYDSSWNPQTIFNWAGLTRLEGMDVVWNPTRRVWGIVHADLLNNEIWFNEIKPDGSRLIAGSGFAVKNNVTPLFSNTSPNSADHTPAHYPRIDYQQFHDEYVVTWVQEGGAGPAGNAKIQIVTATANAGVVTYARKFSPAIDVTSALGVTYTDHPSVAVDNSQTNSGAYYKIGFSCSAGASTTAANLSWARWVLRSDTGASILAASTAISAYGVVSSTDVSSSGESGIFLFACSQRHHKLIHGTDGTMAAGQLTDGVILDFAALGVEAGSKFLYMAGGIAGDRGRDGIVRSLPAVGTLSLHVNDRDQGGGSWANTAGITSYYIAPLSALYVARYDNTAHSTPTLLAGSVDTTVDQYKVAQREPDFVRLSRGDGKWIVIYQSFDTTGFLATTTVPNWDGAINSNFQDYNTATYSKLGDQTPQRLHLATCFTLVGEYGQPLGGTLDSLAVAGSDDFYSRAGWHAGTVQTSLGGRIVPTPNNNAITQFNPRGGYWEMEIAARNYCIPWTETSSPSLIPDVTWSGKDWTIVSPSVNRIKSNTGTYKLAAGPVHCLVDPTMVFGTGAKNSITDDGSYHPPTIVAPGDYLHFPTLAVYVQVTGVSSEHVLILANAPAGAVDGTTYQWSLVRADSTTGATQAGIKNPGFRVSSRGDVLVSTNFFTFADELADSTSISTQTLRRQETLYRRGLFGDYNVPTLYSFGTEYEFGPPLPVNTWQDVFPTSRLELNLFYRGVAVGRPKGFSELLSQETPMCAIAWGENLYGFADRVVAGSTGAPGNFINQTMFYRQSFGPWDAGVKDLAIQGPKAGPGKLQVLSHQHVYTKHGLGRSGGACFGTDGYRNVFAYLGWDRFATQFHPLHADSYLLGVNSVYTSADSRESLVIREGRAIGQISSDLNPAGSGNRNFHRPCLLENLNGSGAKVLWDGQNFVAFMGTMSIVGTVAGGSGTRSFLTPGFNPRLRGIVTMYRLTGGEHTQHVPEQFAGQHVTDPNSAGPAFRAGGAQAVASTVFSCGAAGDADLREALKFDVAFSGKNFCVVWSIGYNASDDSAVDVVTGGCMLGYSIFPSAANTPPSNLEGGFYGYGVQSYTVDVLTSVESYDSKFALIHPQVIWDGQRFVIVFNHYEDDTLLTIRSTVKALTVPEDGPSNNLAIKSIGADNVYTDSGGVLEKKLGFVINGEIDLSQTGSIVYGYKPQPGDILCINRTSDLTTPASAVDIAGWYTIVDYNPKTRRVAVGRDLTAFAGNTVYGVIFGGGAASGTAFGAPFMTNAGTSYTSGVDAPSIGPSSFAGALTRQGDMLFSAEGPNDLQAIWGLVYDPQENVYVVMYQDTKNHVYLAKFGLASEMKLSEPVRLFIYPPLVATLAFNGNSYFVAGGSKDRLEVYEFSRNFKPLYDTAAVVSLTSSGILGNGIGQMPGPGYGANGAGHTGAYGEVTNLKAHWNARLGRWALAVSWITDTTTYEYPYDNLPVVQKRLSASAIAGYADRTITNAPAAYHGQREIWLYEGVVADAIAGAQTYTVPDNWTLEDLGKDYTALGVSASTDWLQTVDTTDPLLIKRRRVQVVSPGGNTARLKYDYPIWRTPQAFYITAGSAYKVIRPEIYAIFNTKDHLTGPSTRTVFEPDGHVTRNLDLVANKVDVYIYPLYREDVFLLTFSSGASAVHVKDADGVTLEDVTISGTVEVSEEYLNMTRMVHKTGGVEVGEVTGNQTIGNLVKRIPRPKVGVQLSTPAGKVDTITFSNVKSSALVPYGYTSTGANRLLRDSANRRK